MRRNLIATLWLAAGLISAVSAQDEDYLICKPVRNLFSTVEHQNNSANQRGPQGSPGKRGPRGFVGAPGSPGPRGSMPDIDWNAIDQHIKVQLDARLSCTGVVYGRYCYKLIIKAKNRHRGGAGGKAWAASECAYRGGSLVDIETEEMYNLLYTYIQDSWVTYTDEPNFGGVDVWLASMYRNGAIRDSSGSRLYEKWHPGHPGRDPAPVSLAVGTKASKGRNVGLWLPDNADFSGCVPLCRFLIN